RDAVFSQILGKGALRAPIADHGGKLANDEASDVRLPGFDIHRVDAVIANEGTGHGDDLAFVRRIGQNLLVAGHAGVETNLAAGLGAGAKTPAWKDRTILKG